VESTQEHPARPVHPFLIIKTGRALPEAVEAGAGDFEDWFIAGLGRGRFDYRVIQVDDPEADVLPDPATLAGALITGSPAMVSDRADWSERTAEWLAGAHEAGLPMLGVCYGHQLLAHALGGLVGPNPFGRRMGRIEVHSIEPDDPLMQRFAPSRPFHVSHSEVVLAPPPGARVIGRAEHDPHHVLYFGGQSWGLQFHPEFGRSVMRAYIRARAEQLAAEGQNPAALVREVADDTVGPAVLARFGALVAEGRRSDAA
jgi:GMP synthase (glutamine-hydrolysing)